MTTRRWMYIGSLTIALICGSRAGAQDAAPAASATAPEPAPAPPALVDIRQVQVQVWISETNEQGLRRLGANLNYNRFNPSEYWGEPPVEQNGSLQQVVSNVIDPVNDFSRVTLPAPTPPPGAVFTPGILRPDESGAAGIQTRSGVGLTANIISTGQGALEGTFRAIENKGDVDLISKPAVLVVNNVPAEIKAGGQIPFQTVEYPKGAPNLSVAWRDIGVNLKLQPTILPNDFVQLHVQQLEVSDVARIENLRGVDLPVCSKRSQTGFVIVPNGQTLVIGGLSSKVERKSERRVPLVGRIPVLGMPFRSRQSEVNVTTLLVFVSPTIVDLREMREDSMNALYFWRQKADKWKNAEKVEEELKAMDMEL